MKAKKKIIKKCEELWIKNSNLIRSITKNLEDYDEKYMKSNLIQMTVYL